MLDSFSLLYFGFVSLLSHSQDAELAEILKRTSRIGGWEGPV